MSEKTEQPTPKRLREARKKGQVAKSQEIVSTASVLAVFAFVWLTSDQWAERVRDYFDLVGRLHGESYESAVRRLLGATLWLWVLLAFPVALVAALAGVMANFFQVGFFLAFEPIKPSLKRLNPTEWFRKVFCRKNLFEFVKSVIKVGLLSLLLRHAILGSLDPLLKTPLVGLNGMESLTLVIVKELAIWVGLAFATIAAVDYFFQKRQYLKGLMMTKEEVTREYKEMEGDPHIKGRRRQLHQEMAMNDVAERVKQSTVLVTNPTRLAIALLYDKEKTPLPRVMAKGEGLWAKRMVDAALEAGVPIMQNVPLAQDLFEQVPADAYIPVDLIEPVAAVLRWVQQLEREQE